MTKIILLFLCLYLLSCSSKNESKQNERRLNSTIKSIELTSEQVFLDSLYTCECRQYRSKLTEIPNRDSNAYFITIKSKKGNWKKSKIINTRPTMSRISFCTDYYTVVSFACGGPCHSETFIFTDRNRPDEQYDYAQKVTNNPFIITHIKNENFNTMIIHNLKNNKELSIEITEIGFFKYGHMDSITLQNDKLTLHYTDDNEKNKSKTVNIKSIL